MQHCMHRNSGNFRGDTVPDDASCVFATVNLVKFAKMLLLSSPITYYKLPTDYLLLY